MLSGVLNSQRAIQVNIQIIRTFTKLRELMNSHKDLAPKIGILERKFRGHDERFVLVFDAIKELINGSGTPLESKEPIGFRV